MVQVGEKNQSVYIYGCGAAIIDVRGKGKSVTLDNCKKTQVRSPPHFRIQMMRFHLSRAVYE